MRIHTLECELVASSALEETFAFFQEPRNLARITPPAMGFRIVSEDYTMRKGLEIEYRVRVAGIPLRWRSLISEYDPPHSFVDEATESPYALWRHHHRFRSTALGTNVTDHVDFALPFPPFGELALPLVARQLRTIFQFRQKSLGSLLGAKIMEIRQPSIH